MRNKDICNNFSIKGWVSLQITAQELPELPAVRVYVFITLFHPRVVVVVMNSTGAHRQLLANESPYTPSLLGLEALDGRAYQRGGAQFPDIHVLLQKLAERLRQHAFPRAVRRVHPRIWCVVTLVQVLACFPRQLEWGSLSSHCSSHMRICKRHFYN